ncbi:hypothetical protein EI42_05650 [Thermosporothrix hazakensis]|jgi:hypothetical protein|uniref:Integrase catalytic domain-containing protein n=1 Tax=Thermosporothrix hazakensis TaxID=644383 RepID=A0A326TXH7_THEHA|nr:hypothetical protein [Thermosporothrix hazakensis]PZW21114.1 hypothetical protein EI42_05650 [Thermosporothrix hazakensis]GCE50721.1 hypothetical protein KTH_55900 [Thermosporothrix hazakensis]
MDLKDASVPPSDADEKRQHVVEVLNFVDAGTSILLEAVMRDDFRAETAFEAGGAFLQRDGCPRLLTFDRDPRWVGSASTRDVPSPLWRFLQCVGITPHVIPPQRPDQQ